MFPGSCPLHVPINCTDSCKQVSCICCSSNVSVRNWEKRTVHYNQAENELQDEPKANALIGLLQQLCCRNRQEETEKRMQACEAISLFLMHNFQVELEEAASHCGIDNIDALKQGRKPIKLSQYHSLKRSAAEIYQRKSGNSTSTNQSVHNNTPVEKFSTPKRKMQRYQPTVWKRPPGETEA